MAVKLDAKQAELVQLVQKFVPRSHVSEFFAMSTPDPTHRTLNLCVGWFHSVRVNLGLLCYGSKVGAKRDELVQSMQKFVPRIRVGIFRNERTQFTPLDIKHMV